MWRQGRKQRCSIRRAVLWGAVVLVNGAFSVRALSEDSQPTPKSSTPASGSNSLSQSKSSQRITNPRDTFRALRNSIDSALDNEDYFGAEALLKQVPENLLKDDIHFLFQQAVVAKGLYRLEESERLLKHLLRKNKKHANALFEMALIQMEQKKWRDAEVLLYLAGDVDGLSSKRQSMLPYYLGVISFEMGRIFSARNSFSRLNWANSLDPALEQSAAAFLGRIARARPWSVVAPLTYQYESNMLGIADSAPLPEGYSQRHGSKLTAGIFSSWNGLGGSAPGEGPYGLGLRVLTIRVLPQQFKALNVAFVEPELNWSSFLGERWGVFKAAAVANWVSAGGKSATASGILRATFVETEVSVGYETDLQKSSNSNRSSYVFRVARDWPLWSREHWMLTLATELGSKIPIDKNNPGEQRSDFALAPALSWLPNRRASLRLTDKFAYERVSDAVTSSYNLIRNTPSLSFSYVAQPYLILSSSLSFEFEKKSNDTSAVNKTSLALTAVGVL